MNISETHAVSTAGIRNDRRIFTLAPDRPGRNYAQSLAVYCPHGCSTRLGNLLANFILDGVRHVHLAGPEGGHIKMLIDAILFRGGFNVSLSTTWYEGETLERVIDFARGYCRQPPGGAEVVQL